MTTSAKVLIVDDDETVRRSYLRSLQTVRCDVETAATGEDALRALARKSFDVVLLDLRMPGMDGMAVLKAARKTAPDSEIVVITGYPTVETAKQAVQWGAYDYLAKPVGPAEVIKVTTDALTQKAWMLRQDPAPEHVCHA
ncbi:MAG TPA: response regulator [Acetobacteraceae bacterium]|nr:response regulator [Acetobacteraceae bacterium]